MCVTQRAHMCDFLEMPLPFQSGDFYSAGWFFTNCVLGAVHSDLNECWALGISGHRVLYQVLWTDLSLCHRLTCLRLSRKGTPKLKNMTQSWNSSSTGFGIINLCISVPDSVQVFNNPELSGMTHLEGCQTGASTFNEIIIVPVHTLQPPFYLVIFSDFEVICLQKLSIEEIFVFLL